MNTPLATDFTGPLYVVMGVGAAVALLGILMVIAIFMGWAKPPRLRKQATGPWDIVKEVIEKIFRWVPTAYRFPVALILLGALIMIIPLGIGLGNAGNGSEPSPTGPSGVSGPSGPTGGSGTTTGP